MNVPAEAKPKRRRVTKTVTESDDKRLAEILKHATVIFLETVKKHGFVSPIEIRILDSRFGAFQVFTVAPDGSVTRARVAKPASFAFPLRIVGTDARQRVARIVIGANGFALPPEYLN